MMRAGNPKNSDMGNVYRMGNSDLQEPLLDYHALPSCRGRVPNSSLEVTSQGRKWGPRQMVRKRDRILPATRPGLGL